MKIFRKILRALDRYDEAHNYTCDVCGGEVFGGERVCKRCLDALPWNNKLICPYCGRKVLEAGACIECKAKPLSVSAARSVFTYEGEAARLVLRMKRGERYLCATLVDFLLPFAELFVDVDAITYVPMTPRSERKRGYNQSFLLAQGLSDKTGLPLLACAEKVRETKAQKTLSRRAREENLKGCFKITDRSAVKDKSVLIVDDTMTTGSTASELAERLKSAGAQYVYLLTVTSVQLKENRQKGIGARKAAEKQKKGSPHVYFRIHRIH